MASTPTDSDSTSLHAPRHPVPQLQGPFEESMAESVHETTDRARPDPMTRRTMLLEGPTYERVCAGRWKQKPGERFHPLWKITAQMSFGIHLLAEGLAKSEDEVMAILQTHVDDVDGFLESTTEDFDLAQSDVAERLRYLKLPLEHGEVFDRMLLDRSFRVSIVEGNEKIEHIMARTSEATRDALKDVQKGLQSTDALGKYLEKVDRSWTNTSPEHDAVFVAMVGNVEGWHRAFEDLYHQGAKLGVALVQLATIVAEMQRRAGVASRKTLNEHDYAALRSQRSSPGRVGGRDTFATNNSSTDLHSPPLPSKPLPRAPELFAPPKRSTRRMSFHESRPTQTSAAVSDDKSTLDAADRRDQAGQRRVVGDKAKRLKNQMSTPDLKPKLEPSNMAVGGRASELASLGLGAGLGLGQVKETKSSRPVIVERPSIQGGRGSSSPHLPSNSKPPREQLVRSLKVTVQYQAPPPRKRLSFSLRSKHKDRLIDSQPAPASPTVSGTLLKSALSPRAGASTGPASGPDNDVSSPRSASHNSPDSSYANASLTSPRKVVSPSPGPKTTSPAAILKPRKYHGHNPTFTSHPPNMEMAISPPLNQGEAPELSVAALNVPSLRALPDLDSGHTSYESSLGEPGPEVLAAGDGEATGQETPLAELGGGTPVIPGPSELEAVVPSPPQPVAFELEAPQQMPSMPPNTSTRTTPLAPTVGATIQSHSDFFTLPSQQAAEQASKGVEPDRNAAQMSPTVTPKDQSRPALQQRRFQLPAARQSTVMGLLPLDTEKSTDAVGHPSFPRAHDGPDTGVHPASAQDGGSRYRTHERSFELPAITAVGPIELDSVPDASRKTSQRRSFQLPREGQAKDRPSMRPVEQETRISLNPRSSPGPSLSQQPAEGAKAAQTRGSGERDSSRDELPTLPSRMSASEVMPKSKRHSAKQRLSLIDLISHTPPGSPIHDRPPSGASFHSAANSARLTSYRASVDLAPPEEAPAPPAPGGRGMVNPDYAAAGAFEGEKRPQRASGASMNGLKKIFSGGSANHSRAGSVRVVELPEGRMSGDGDHNHADLTTPGASDVLWFKGMGRDGVWVSGT